MVHRQQVTRYLTDRFGVRFAFDSGAVALDLMYSGLPGRWSFAEVLHEPADLSRWLAASDLGLTGIAVAADEFERATNLRPTLFAVFGALAVGSPVPVPAVAALNAQATVPPLVPQWSQEGLTWTNVGVDAALSTIARQAIGIVGTAPERVRQCAAGDCALVFYDDSRSGLRRWCSMQRCGNRNKVRVHRSRSAGGGQSASEPDDRPR